MSNIESYDLFIRATQGRLSKEEQRAFNARLSSDPALKKEFDEFNLTSSLVLEHDLQKFKIALEDLDYTPKKKYPWRNIGLASIIGIGAIGAALVYTNLNSENSTNDLNQSTDTISLHTASTNTNHSDTNIHNRSVDIIELQAAPEPIIRESNIETSADTLISAITDTSKHVKTAILLEVKTEDKKEVITKDRVIVNCNTVYIQPAIKFSNPCYNEENGYLSVDQIEGGTGPYTIVINGEENENSFEDFYLGPNTYEIHVADKNECAYKTSLTLTEKRCLEESVLISPSLGNYFEIPTNGYEAIWLKIQDPNNNTVFEKTFEDYESKIWKGTNTNDQPLNTGIYFFIVKFADEPETYMGQIELR